MLANALLLRTDFCYDEVPDRDEDVKSHNAEGGNIECVLAGTYHETFLCEGRPSEPEVLAELVVDDNFPLEPLSREVVPAICVQSLMQESPCNANVSGGQVETSRGKMHDRETLSLCINMSFLM